MYKRSFVAGALSIALVAAATACSSSASDKAATPGANSDQPVTITVWGWDGTVEAAVPGFEKTHPNIKVDVVNAGSSFDEYQALDNAIQAGSGVPDLAMFEYFSVSYFAIPGKLTDLSKFGAKDFESDYVPGAWNNVVLGDGVYALPSDYGPAVMFYNMDTFAKAGIDSPPKTWEEYYQDAKAIHALGSDYYIMNDNADIFLLQSLIWQSGGRPFKVDGYDVNIDFSQPYTKRAVDYWQRMLDEGLVTTSFAAWSDDWNRTLNNGTLATQLIGGWFTSTLPERAPEQKGNFRVAPLPQWKDGQNVGAENGGSAFGIPKDAPHPDAAYQFLEYFTHGDGVQTRVDQGAFVPNVAVLNDPAFLSHTDAYFGDQEYRKVLAEASKDVATGWQYPPFFEWARSVYGDIAIPYYTTGKGSLEGILDEWKKQMTAYGNDQGFTVNK